MKYYAALKEQNHMIFSNMDGIQGTMLSDISQKEWNRYRTIPHIYRT